MTAHPLIPGDLFARTQTVAGLRALADFLNAHPEIPVREYGWEYTVFPRKGSDAAGLRSTAGSICMACGRTRLTRP